MGFNNNHNNHNAKVLNELQVGVNASVSIVGDTRNEIVSVSRIIKTDQIRNQDEHRTY